MLCIICIPLLLSGGAWGFFVRSDHRLWKTVNNRCINCHSIPLFTAANDSIASVPSAAAYKSPTFVMLTGDDRRAYVINQGNDTVSEIDTASKRVLRTFATSSHPVTAALSIDERQLFVACTDSFCIDVIDIVTGTKIRSFNVGLAPFCVRSLPDGKTLLVSDAIGGKVLFVNSIDGTLLNSVTVQSDPRFMALTPDGTTAVLANAMSRSVSLIDTVSAKLRATVLLHQAAIIRNVCISSDGRWAFVAHLISRDKQITTQIERGWIHSNGFSVIDLENPSHPRTLLLDQLLSGAANPFGMALSADDKTLYISLAGVHELAIVDVARVLQLVAETSEEDIPLLAQNVEVLHRKGIVRRVPTGGLGPRGIAFNKRASEVWVANYFSDTITVLDAKTGLLKATIALGDSTEMSLLRKGELLFNDARLCYQTWFSCASCHQEDALIDGLNWDLMNDGVGNPKNVKSLYDAKDTPPAMWSGVRKDMAACVAAGQRFLGSHADSKNQMALLTFIGTLPYKPNPWRRHYSREKILRGANMFLVANCQTCHTPPLFTDLRKYDLNLRAKTDLRDQFDTPSLRGCYRTAPYLHDGRAPTLRSIFTQHDPQNLHGDVSTLSEADLDDLIAYIRTIG